nr:hypothetical protein [Clostridia bacterium]
MESLWVVLVRYAEEINVSQEAYKTKEDAIEFIKSRGDIEQVNEFIYVDIQKVIIYEIKNISVK